MSVEFCNKEFFSIGSLHWSDRNDESSNKKLDVTETKYSSKWKWISKEKFIIKIDEISHTGGGHIRHVKAILLALN